MAVRGALPPPAQITRRLSRSSMEWQPLRTKLVVEAQLDHFTGGRFQHEARFLRWRPEKACTMKQVKRKNRPALGLLQSELLPAPSLKRLQLFFPFQFELLWEFLRNLL
jgi:hypothetical protein